MTRKNPEPLAGLPKTSENDTGIRLVTSAHLATSYPELSEFEFGLTLAAHAYQRWLIRCMKAAGGHDMSVLDVLIIHHVTHRGSEKRLADICFVLNIEDSHTASYSLRKLVSAGFVQSEKRGKETFYSITPEGKALCERYKEVRDKCLVSSFAQSDEERKQIEDFAKMLRNFSGVYDQASRGATCT